MTIAKIIVLSTAILDSDSGLPVTLHLPNDLNYDSRISPRIVALKYSHQDFPQQLISGANSYRHLTLAKAKSLPELKTKLLPFAQATV